MTIHQVKVHAEYDDTCFMCRVSTVMLGGGTHDTKSGESGGSAKMEKQLELDRPAYKSMRDQGLRPAKLIGAHELMTKAETSFEIESGKLMPGKAKEIESITKEFKDSTGIKLTESSAVAV